MLPQSVKRLWLIYLLVRAASALPGQVPPVFQGTDRILHRFHPAASTQTFASGAEAALAGSAGGLAQIGSLHQERFGRNAAQLKLDSRLLYTERMLLGREAAPGVAALETDTVLDQADRLLVELSAAVSRDLENRLDAVGAEVVQATPQLHALLALVPPEQLETIAGWPEVRWIAPCQEGRTNAPSLTTEGDLAHQAATARSQFGAGGAGLNIGVLSDGVDHLADSQAFGTLGPVNVLQVGGVSQVGNGDEGTAMLEIVHDLAPEANLWFATAGVTVASFAQNIRALRSAGCDIILDDYSYYLESPFQDGQAANVVSPSNGGALAQAVNDVAADGALYFSCAANSGNLDSGTSGTYEGDFVDGGAASGILSHGGRVHQFSAGVDYDTLTSSGEAAVLTWADPLGTAQDEYDLYVLSPDGSTVVAASTNVANGAGDPVQAVGSTACAAGNRIVVVHAAGSTPYFRLATNRGTLAVATSGAVYGHNAASSGFTVAATPAATAYAPGDPTGPYPGPFTASAQVEPFSSDGPRRIFFHADGTAITPGNFSSTGGSVLAKPDFTAADGVTVSGAGGFQVPFFGTSAATPHAGAIAALVKSARPDLGNAAITSALDGAAVDLLALGWDRDSGYGVLMPVPALAALGPAATARPDLGAIAAAPNPGSGDGWIEPGDGGQVSISLVNRNTSAAATSIQATLASATAGVTVLQPATLAYGAIAAGGTASAPAPFTFFLDPDFPASESTASFTLTLQYGGGAGPSRSLAFSLPVGAAPVQVPHALGSAPATVQGLTATTGIQGLRVNRTGSAMDCSGPKTWPGTYSGTGARAYDAYTFTACQSACAPITLSTSGTGLFVTLYASAYSPANLAANYLGDCGRSAAIEDFTCSFIQGQTYTVVVHEVDPGGAVGQTYTLTLPGCVIHCPAPTQVPVAKVHDVTMTAGVGGTAAASVDDGSYDPDGAPVTLVQAPPGPYPLGTTAVLLTVSDPLGAAAQATANVTVLAPTAAGATSTTLTGTGPSVFGSAVTFTATVSSASGSPTGTVAFLDGSNTLASSTLSGATASCTTSALSAGNHSITAVYAGSANFAGSVSSSLALAVSQAASATTLAAGGSSFYGQAVTLTATVGSASGTPTGSVTFMDGTANLGSASLSGGTAAFTTSSLAAGTHSLTAVYSGATDFTASTSPALTLAVSPTAIQLASNTQSLSLAADGSAAFQFTPTAEGVLAAPLTFACSGLPDGVTAAFSPIQLEPSALGQAVLVTFTTSAAAQAAAFPVPGPPDRWGWLLLVPGLLAAAALPRRNWRRAGLAALGLALLAASACGGGSGGAGGAPGVGTVANPAPTTYHITITAQAAGASSGTLALDLTVQ
jgi:hypothetical protein